MELVQGTGMGCALQGGLVGPESAGQEGGRGLLCLLARVFHPCACERLSSCENKARGCARRPAMEELWSSLCECVLSSPKGRCVLGGERVTSTQPSRDKKLRAAGLRGKEKCNSAACS